MLELCATILTQYCCVALKSQQAVLIFDYDVYIGMLFVAYPIGKSKKENIRRDVLLFIIIRNQTGPKCSVAPTDKIAVSTPLFEISIVVFL